MEQWYGFTSSSESCYKFNLSEMMYVNISVNYEIAYDNETVNGATEGASVPSGPFGMPWNFSVMVRDPDNDDVKVSLIVDTGNGFVELD